MSRKNIEIPMVEMTQDQAEEFRERAAIIAEGCSLDREKSERLAAIYMGLDYEDVIEFLQWDGSAGQ
jgi:hypothetical protein